MPPRTAVVFAFFLSLCLPVPGAEAQSGVDVRFIDQRLTVHARAVPLRLVIERVGNLANIEVINSERLDGLTSVDLDGEPILNAVKTLLVEFNYVLTRKARADTTRGPTFVLRIHSRAGAVSLERRPIFVPALESFHAQQLAEPGKTEAIDDRDRDPADTEAKVTPDEPDVTDADHAIELAQFEAEGAFAETVPFESLADDLQSDNPFVRQRAMTEINRRDSTRSLPHIIDALGAIDIRVSDHAVEILSRRGDLESLERLAQALARRDGDPLMRTAAFRALAARADPAAVKVVEHLGDDAHPVIREAAAQFLREMRSRASKPRQ